MQEEQEVPAQEAPQQLEQSLETRVLAGKLLNRSQPGSSQGMLLEKARGWVVGITHQGAMLIVWGGRRVFENV